MSFQHASHLYSVTGPKQKNVNKFLMKTTGLTKQVLDKAVAKCIYDCNLPFGTVDDPVWLSLLRVLRPGYTPPSASTVSRVLLKKVYDEEVLVFAKEVDCKYATMSIDG